ncbi:transcriptional regulator [Microbispora cellulosiformans]|uniref:Transcriptional regulator n=1 Tax=Microbispora cellulosiformans TaxID=2614688 RepID=A0A5J5K9S8_9ACTN|nr:ATP-binding protein [Microbispora cellulosiformans]KAA9381637.1 transcriptional regulator [Microbispora cellulosiformans]
MEPEALNAVLDTVGAGVPADALESETLDFKLVADSPRVTFSLLADALVCFINAQGGTVVLGVDDKATVREAALRGVPASYSLDGIRKGVFDQTSPPITPFVVERFVDGVRLVVVSVPRGVMPHSNAAGLATRRLGKECLPFPPAQQREVMIARGQIDWSADASGAGLDDLSAVEVARLRDLLVAAGRDHIAELSDRAMLEALRLIAPGGGVTNAGVLLLADERALRTIVPSYGYSYQFRPTLGSEATGRARGTKPLLAAIDAMAEAVATRREIHPLTISGGVQLQLTDYPQDAVRELIVNAFIHRSFETGGTVDIEHSPERLVITSPGGLVAGVTPDNILTHPSTPRNRLLTEAISALQLAERTGQGIDRAYREMLRVGKEPPTIEDNGTFVRATLPGGIGNDAFVRFVGELPAKAGRDVNVLLTLSHLRGTSTVDALRLAAVIQRPPAEAQEVLSRMAEEFALLEPTRRTVRKPFPTYRLRAETVAAMSRAVAYRRRGVDGTDQKVIDHVREYGFVTNRTLQRLFDIQVYAARDMLDDLRARRILEKIGDARGGTGVRYGPGPAFPR